MPRVKISPPGERMRERFVGRERLATATKEKLREDVLILEWPGS